MANICNFLAKKHAELEKIDFQLKGCDETSENFIRYMGEKIRILGQLKTASAMLTQSIIDDCKDRVAKAIIKKHSPLEDCLLVMDV